MSASNLKSIITIENFPSRNELIKMLTEYLKQNNQPTNSYTLTNRSNCLEITLQDTDLAYGFVKKINLETCKNSLYSNVKCSLGFKQVNKKTVNTNKKSTNSRNAKTKLRSASSTALGKQGSLASSYEHTHWKDITQKAGIIGNDSPYLPDDKYLLQEYHKNKKKWMSKNGFNNFVGKATANRMFVIKNYVQQTPSKPPVLYSFREIEKKKWMSEKGFVNF